MSEWHTIVHDESFDFADKGIQLPRSKFGKFRFSGSPDFGEIGSQSGRDATQYSNRRPDLPIRVSKPRELGVSGWKDLTFFEPAATPVVTAPTMT